MVNRRLINPKNIKQGNGSCIFMTFSLILECFARRTVYVTLKEFLKHTKGLDIGNCTLAETETILFDEAYITNPIEQGDVHIDHKYMKDYFYSHLYDSMNSIEAYVKNTVEDIALIEETLKDKTSLISLALHQTNNLRQQETHIVVVGYDNEFYVVDTRKKPGDEYDLGKFSLGDSVLNFNNIDFPGFVLNKSRFTIGDCLLLVKSEVPNQ